MSYIKYIAIPLKYHIIILVIQKYICYLYITMDKIPIQEKVLKILLDKKIELIKQMEALDTLYIITLSTRINEF